MRYLTWWQVFTWAMVLTYAVPAVLALTFSALYSELSFLLRSPRKRRGDE